MGEYVFCSFRVSLIFIILLVMLPCPGMTEYSVIDEEAVPCEEELPALPEGFVRVRELIPDLIEEMRYASTHNFTGAVVEGYEANTAILTVEAAQALRKAGDIFRGMGLRIKIYDAYRPKRSVKSFMAWAANDDLSTKEEFYPGIRSKMQLVDQGYIARNSAHMKGSAIDMTLTDLDGVEMDMGTCFDFFGPRAWHGARGLTPEQEENRKTLRGVMEQCGFKAFEHEWWHYRLVNQPWPDTNFDFPVK